MTTNAKNNSEFLKNMALKEVDHQPQRADYQSNQPGNSMPFGDARGNYQRNIGFDTGRFKDSKVYIVGGGIGGLAAAYYFIRDAHIPGENITFLEELAVQGGSLDGAGNAKDGYIMRGGREMITTYENFWDMFQDIPALELPEPYSVLDEYRLINDNDPNYSKARLIHNKGEIKDFHKFNLNKADQLAIVRLLLKNQDELDNLTIEDYFSQSFLDSNFWTLWRSMFAFENWHSLLECKLYMHRFLEALDGIKDMSTLLFAKYNQYDSFVVPAQKFLINKGVNLQSDTLVTAVDFEQQGDKRIVKGLTTTQQGQQVHIPVRDNDFVIITTGSMTEDTRYGTSDTAPDIRLTDDTMGKTKGWVLWNDLAKQSAVFGRPEKFNRRVPKSAWMSATLTCKDSALLRKISEKYCVNPPLSGKTVTGGIVTITDSNWLMSFTINRQPQFLDQPKDVVVIWVYGLLMDKKGNYVPKTMPECTGHEIVMELLYHLDLLEQKDDILANTIANTAYMPYITSMFMPRAKGDRPQIVPEGCTNLGLIGQFVETNNDVVFTVETSVRSARVAVYTLTDCNKQVPDIVPTQYDIRNILRSASTLNDDQGFIGEGILRRVLANTYYEHILPPVAKKAHKDSSLMQSLAEQFEVVKAFWHKEGQKDEQKAQDKK
ncbi:oleate hydratase [Moraxella osloensis]|uniref:Oleate hydratase n=1 Tax=Faucicola osloensis TaxID=34062 RepID=A0AAW6TDA2_FAUOS|nr:oleate hydratase [Moraxella osloensis]MDI4510633.1 oleate hydratase [Moraxella osloensis]